MGGDEPTAARLANIAASVTVRKIQTEHAIDDSLTGIDSGDQAERTLEAVLTVSTAANEEAKSS